MLQRQRCTAPCARSSLAAGYWVPSHAHSRSRARCHATTEGSPVKGRLVFLGTPDVAALVLRELVEASRLPNAAFEVVGVVSQPGKPRGRGNKSTPVPTPVEEAAAQLGLQANLLSPKSARDPAFLDTLAALRPDLCITAAYGNMLPQRFLDTPRLGTLNIHPSLLPKYRGAAPVQRCLQSGDSVGGVSVAYTVLACDAGPVLAQKQVLLDPNIQAPELLSELFHQGVGLLLDHLPEVLAEKGSAMAVPQDSSAATHAAKLLKDESVLDLTLPASVLHNTVRGLAGWPGTVARLQLIDDVAGSAEPLELRIIRTTCPSQADVDSYQALPVTQPGQEIGWVADGSGDMLIPCGVGSAGTAENAGLTVLRVASVQPPTKKAMPARDFRNGLRKKRLVVPQPTGAAQLATAAAL